MGCNSAKPCHPVAPYVAVTRQNGAPKAVVQQLFGNRCARVTVRSAALFTLYVGPVGPIGFAMEAVTNRSKDAFNAVAPCRLPLSKPGRFKVPAYRQSRSFQKSASIFRIVPGSVNKVLIPNLSTSPMASTYFPWFSSLKTRM